MEDAIVDWKNEGEKEPEEYKSDVVSWVLKQGQSVGKMILVTGIVISSAPVVIPPLVVISAFGIAISVPYGVFLVSYACTEKLMAFLLPKAVPPSMEEYRALTYDEEDDGDEKKDEKKTLEEDEQVERTRNAGEKKKREEPALKNNGNEEKRIEIEVIPVKEKKGEEDKAKDIEIQVEAAKETPNLVKQKRDDNKGIASDVVLDKEMGPKVTEIVQVIEQKKDDNIENKTTTPDKKSPRKAKNVPKKGMKQTAQIGSGTSPVEEVYSEKKIWEEINALRTIVGYKAPSLPSSMEELKALYRFTGVEPPASINNPSNLAEVTNKLRFLMAIVGVN